MIRAALEHAVSAHGSRQALAVGATNYWTYNELFDRVRATAEELTNVASDEVMHMAVSLDLNAPRWHSRRSQYLIICIKL